MGSDDLITDARIENGKLVLEFAGFSRKALRACKIDTP